MACKDTSSTEINKMLTELTEKVDILERRILSGEEEEMKEMKEKQMNQMSSYFAKNDANFDQKLKPPQFKFSIQSVRHGVQFDGVDHTVTIQLLVSNLEHLKQRFEELEMEEDTAMKKIEELFKRLEELARIDQAQRDDILHERNNNMLKEVQIGKCVIRLVGFSKYQQDPGNGGESMIAKVFYSSPRGYKMKFVLYPNGISGEEEGYLFVELAILNGDYDSLLPWPFRQRVTITILNQDSANDLVTAFTQTEGYPNAPAFIMSRLLPLQELDEESGFIKDDTFNIKCEVEQEEFVKSN